MMSPRGRPESTAACCESNGPNQLRRRTERLDLGANLEASNKLVALATLARNLCVDVNHPLGEQRLRSNVVDKDVDLS